MILTNYYNGEGRSKYDGWDSIDKVDVHSEIGTARCQFDLVSESTTPNEDCVQATSENGDVYFASTESGKIWKRTVAGSYSLANTNANGAHRGIIYFNNYIYYWTATKLGRYNLDATWTDTYQTFTNGNARGGHVHYDTLFIADGNFIASLTTTPTFTANAFDVPSEFIGTDIVSYQSYILMGTIVDDDVSYAKGFLWDTVSTTWTRDDTVYEIGINTFIEADNILFALCGTAGRLYYWTGTTFKKFRKIRGVTLTVGATNHALSTVYNGKALIALGSEIYSIHTEDSDSLPYAIIHEFTADAAIISLGVSGSTLLVSNGAAIEKNDTNYATATITSPVVKAGLNEQLLGQVQVLYESMPTGCSLSLETNVNGAGWVSETITKKLDMKYELDDGVKYDGPIRFMQARVTLTPATTNTPVIQDFIIL